jgi:hypothetical protein
MKGLKITYWTSTILISLMMLFSAAMYFTPEVTENFGKIGYPNAFRIELGIAKFLGAIVLLIPIMPRIKEWAYFGFFLTFVSAIIAHLSIGDTNIAPIFVAIALLVTSYVTYHRLAQLKSTAATR